MLASLIYYSKMVWAKYLQGLETFSQTLSTKEVKRMKCAGCLKHLDEALVFLILLKDLYSDTKIVEPNVKCPSAVSLLSLTQTEHKHSENIT